MTKIWLLVTALVGVASLGCAGAKDSQSFDGSPPTPMPTPTPMPVATVSLSGRWGVLQQYAESDAVILDQGAAAFAGTGCSGYLPPEGSTNPYTDTCGPITGNIDGRHVRFQFQVDFSGGVTFAADVYMSADGNRMAGRFFTALQKNASLDGPGWLGEPTAWGRLAPSESWFARPAWPSDVDQALSDLGAGYDLTLVDDPNNGDDFSTLRTYRLARLASGLVGDLGAFLPNEISFTQGPTGETTTILAGPVPETAPGLPIALTVELQGGAVVRVQASMASGATYAFTAAKVAAQ
ncbi:MAG TPA: hypothetical protein VGL59_12125 [Polyangia bacterium]|jgi:hypothetical protein